MKKIILLAFVMLSSLASFAQSSGPELGVRFGGGYGIGINSIDGILPLSDMNRLHVDLGLGNHFISVDALYEWQFDIGQNFLVYPGVGAGFYSWTGYRKGPYEYGGYSTVVVEGVIGLEYQIQEIPLSVGLDFRPVLGLMNSAGYGSGWGFMVRYRF